MGLILSVNGGPARLATKLIERNGIISKIDKCVMDSNKEQKCSEQRYQQLLKDYER